MKHSQKQVHAWYKFWVVGIDFSFCFFLSSQARGRKGFGKNCGGKKIIQQQHSGKHHLIEPPAGDVILIYAQKQRLNIHYRSVMS